MKQADPGLKLTTKRARKCEFVDEMNRVVPWAALVDLVGAHPPEGKKGRPPFPVETMLRIHFMQQWFALSDPASEEALHDVPLFRQFAGLDNWGTRLPDEGTILRFRHLLEKHKLAPQVLGVVNELLRGKGQVHTVHTTAGHVYDVVEANSLLHGEETDAFGDAGDQGADKRPDANPEVTWHVAMRPGWRKALALSSALAAMIDKPQQRLAAIRAKVETPFRVIKRQFGFTKVRYSRLKKNAARVQAMFALSNLWMTRRKLMAGAA